MAYSTLLSLEEAMNQILDQDRFFISHHERKQIMSLQKCVILFQAFLEDFPKEAKILEARIRDIAVEAEDIIEWFSWKQIRDSYRYIKCISILRGINFKYQLQKVRRVMDSIVAEVVEIQNSSIIIKDIQHGDSVWATSSSQVADTSKINIVGLNEDLKEIKDRLCEQAPQLQVLPIIGMGGIGKTTLARNAYDDQLIKEHFKIRIWVTVSQDYTIRRILLDLLDSMKEFDPEFGNEAKKLEVSKMEVKVYKILSCKRFLIVMDDIWSTKVLDDVKHLFPNCNNRSRILLTTRLTEVATYANSSILPHEMRLIDVEQSWNLLCAKVFIHQDHVPRELESIGKEIARSCRGLPLAIVVIGGLLSKSSKTLSSWKEVAKNIRSSLITTDGQIEKILSLSYNHLPHHLKSCFLYMGGFPEDHEIKATDLIRLWIAESFVKLVPSEESEDTAEGYLEDLVARSLIVVTKRKLNGKIKCCSLHDTIRELCINLSKGEKFLGHFKSWQALELPKSMKDRRRVSISHSHLNSLSTLHVSNIRTIIQFEGKLHSLSYRSESLARRCFRLLIQFQGKFHSLSYRSESLALRCFRLLRVLDLLNHPNKFHSLGDQLFMLFHLRYLAFNYHRMIPGAISNFQNLQTLIIKWIGDTYLTYEIWNMPQLRHLILPKFYLPNTHVALENLQTLGVVRDLICSKSNLNMIPNIRKLTLSYSSVSGDLLLHNVVHLRQLETLHLELEYGKRGYHKLNLVFPSSLKKLTLIGWGHFQPYLSIVGPFPNLEGLKLRNFEFEGNVWQTSEEDFPHLESLLIEKSNLMQWETESSHFPRLNTLRICSCPLLSQIPDCIAEFPTLELIELKFCRDSLADSAKQIQEEAQSYGNDFLQVCCVDSKAITDSITPPWFYIEPLSPSSSPSQSTVRSNSISNELIEGNAAWVSF